VTNYTNVYAGGVRSLVIEQKLLLHDNSTMSVLFEDFENDTSKEYATWIAK